MISFGSNLGRRESIIADAAHAVASSSLVHEMKASRLFETPPIGGPEGQEPFLNAVAVFETAGSASEILALLQQVELRLGRTRDLRWDSRSIDLDVVLHGELVGGTTGLIVPHPRYTARQFVLQPACDVAAHYRDPRFGWDLQTLSHHLERGEPSMSLVGGDEQLRHDLLLGLTNRHGIQTFPEQSATAKVPVIANVPQSPGRGDWSQHPGGPEIPADIKGPWVSGFLPILPDLTSDQTESPSIPRLVARIQRTTPSTRWPAPHQLWPAGWQWPEYRLEVDDRDWAVDELASALRGMRCPLAPVTNDGNWWTD